MTELLLRKSMPMMWREWVQSGRLKGELLRLLCAGCWFGLAALVMAIVQMNGDSLHARNVKSPLEAATALLQIPTFNTLFDVSFDSLPQLAPTNPFNPDNVLHSFILASVVAGLFHWPLLTFIARLRRFGWLFGTGYLLRMCSLASTVLPPSNPLCVPVERTLPQMFLTAPKLLFGMLHTCTDKLFSGHTMVATLLVWFWQDARSAVGDRWFSPWRAYPVVHSLLMVLASVMGWNHYTVDIVLAFIIATLLHWVYKELLVIGQLQTRYASGGSCGAESDEIKSVPRWLVQLCAWCDGADLVTLVVPEDDTIAGGQGHYMQIV